MMLISELIDRLQALKDKYGEARCLVLQEGMRKNGAPVLNYIGSLTRLAITLETGKNEEVLWLKAIDGE